MLNLSEPVLKIEEVEFWGDVVYIRHLPAPTILKFAKRGQELGKDDDGNESASMMYELIIEAVCDKNGKSLNYKVEDLEKQPFAIINELAQLIMSINSPEQKKS